MAGIAFGFGIWIFRNIEKTILILLLLAIPLNLDINFFFDEGHTAGMNSISVGLVDVFAFALLVIWLFGKSIKKRRGICWYPKISIPLILMIAIAAVSAVKAPNPEFSMFEIVLFIKGLLIFLYLINTTHEESQLEIILVCLAVGALTQSILGLLQHYTGSSLGLGIMGESDVLWEQELNTTIASRIGGTIGYTNDYAKYLSFFIPIIISALFSHNSKLIRIFFITTLIAVTFTIFFTLSRVASTGIALASFIVFILQQRKKSIRLWYPLLGVSIMLLIAFTEFDLIKQRLTSDDQESSLDRIITSAVAIKIIKDHPVMGVGANNYEVVVPQYGDHLNPWTFKAAVHNLYLLCFAENGIIGFTVFIVLNIVLLYTLWMSQYLAQTFARCMGIGAFGAYVALFLQGFADFGLKNNQPRFILFWVVIGAVVATANFKVISNRAILINQNP